MSRWLRILRLPFLSITLIAWLVGVAAAHFAGVEPEAVRASMALAFGLLVHAGANVLNDYFDALNGSDASNTDRIAPFTGGSRLIQDGEVSERATRDYGVLLLMFAAIPGGLLVQQASLPALGMGLAGLAIGWMYSAPPVALMSRGLGELGIGAAWALMLTGSALVHGDSALVPALAAAPGYATMVALILFLNTFPDRAADAQAGKHTLVVRVGPQQARWFYPGLMAGAYAWPLAMIALDGLPAGAAWCALALPLSIAAAVGLWRHAEQPAQLGMPIRLTIAAALLYGLGLAAGFA